MQLSVKRLFIYIAPLVLAASLVSECRAGASFTSYGLKDGVKHFDIKAVTVDGHGRVWAASKSGGVSSFDGASWTYYDQDGLGMGAIRDASVDPLGDPWFATGGGAMKYNGIAWITLDKSGGLPESSTIAVTAAADGSTWIAWFTGPAGGVSRLKNGVWTHYDKTNSGLGDVQIFAIMADRNGRDIWFGTKSAGAVKFDGTTWTAYDSSNVLKANEVREIVQDLSGVIWFCTRNGGVTRFDGTAWTTFTTADGLGFDSVWGLAADSVGNLWCATYGGGVSKFDGKTWATYTETDGLLDNTTNCIVIDRLGRRWIGTDKGVNMMTGENQPPVETGCDINGDGRIGLTDVLALILLQRRNPADSRADFNADGNVDTADVLRLFREVLLGSCLDAAASILASAGDSGPLDLDPVDIAYVEQTLDGIRMDAGEKSMLLAALHQSGPLLPRAFSLSQNYPNPFNPSTQITFSVPQGGGARVSFRLYDIQGRLVRTLAEGPREPGTHRVFWDGTGPAGHALAAGVYFYVLSAGAFVATRKMVLLK